MYDRGTGRGSTRARGLATLALVAGTFYLLYGVVGTLTGAGVQESWVRPLPLLVAVSLGMGVVRYRRG
ncbi:hypothetical protein [Streptomyces sp. NPDC023327]|uniref:hypothetical protein n=1 Tax=Streptomyces sp. NPDC023327 TaxID=3157088 RepID=UPI00340062EF